jgi:predicted anti-sigma-YlaC factor YlaD
MTHVPYEEWLFDATEDLSAQQAVDLNQHLEACEHCRTLSASLGRAEQSLRSAPLLAPVTGFAARWQLRLEIERQRIHRRQISLALGISLAGLVTLLTCLVLLFWPYMDSLDATFWAGLYQLLGLYALAQAVGDFFVTLFRATFDILPVVLWILVLGIVSELSVLWVVSYRLLTNPRRLSTK